jgi:hypothetical protein
VEGWSEFPELSEFITEMGQVSTHAQGAVPFLADLGGRSIAAATLVVHGGVGLLAGASTVPSARRQGAQAALLAARLRYAVEHGCDLAMICALPGSDSQRNAERNGFRVAYTRAKWHLPRT